MNIHQESNCTGLEVDKGFQVEEHPFESRSNVKEYMKISV